MWGSVGQALVLFDVFAPLRGNVLQRKNRCYWADRDTGATVYAFIGVNVELVAAVVDAFHRANFLT
jgi:hypothetical protein